MYIPLLADHEERIVECGPYLPDLRVILLTEFCPVTSQAIVVELGISFMIVAQIDAYTEEKVLPKKCEEDQMQYCRFASDLHDSPGNLYLEPLAVIITQNGRQAP